MALAAGTRFGHYEIVALIGAGGMGEVYRADDSRLHRAVALKVIPESLVAEGERLARFEREARVLASLNHPGIASVYGFEPAGGGHALVMELVEGPTLADRIAQGALPIEEALPIARQVAEAVEYAHDVGVVHRDLKPANIKLRPDGAVKVLDFGLAKALEGEGANKSNPSLTQSPTIAQQMTVAGIILGTAAYMAPEQAKGRAVDRRADIWAFGIVLFEMLLGRQVFAGETVSETLAAVMKDELPWAALPPSVPAGVRRLLERCLTREPRQRLQSIGEARIVLEHVLAGGADAPEDAVAGSPTRKPVPVVSLVAIVAAIAAFSAVASSVLTSRSHAPGELRKYPLAVRGVSGAAIDATISPDARSIAYFAGDTLWVRDLVTLDARPLAPVNQSVFRPFWSPDGQSIGYSEGDRIMRIGLASGAGVPICRLPGGAVGGTGASWGEDGNVWFALGAGGLYSVPAAGGDAREVIPHDSLASDYHEALALPGGHGVLFIRHRLQGGPDTFALWDGKSWRDVMTVPDGSLARPAWSPSGHLLFQRRDAAPGVWAVPYSLARGRTTGEPFLLAATGASPSAARNGTLLYTSGVGQGDNWLRVVWVDREGAVLDTLSEPLPGAFDLRLSPDGRRAVVNSVDRGNTDIWVIDLERRNKTRLTFDTSPQNNPAWAPDGRRVVFVETQTRAIRSLPAEGGGGAVELGTGGNPFVSPAGGWLVFERPDPVTKMDLWVQPLDSAGAARPIVAGRLDDARPAISPDGRFMAYQADEGGRSEVFLTRFPSGEGRWQVSVTGGRRVRWSPEGDRLYYSSSDGAQLHEVAVQLGDTPTIGQPRQLFDLSKSSLRFSAGTNYDIERGGRRILALQVPHLDRERTLPVLVENWAAEFAKRK